MDEMKASILIQAKADDNQIKKEVDKAGNEIQQESKKARTKIVIEADIKDAQEKFNKLSAEYKELKNRSASPVVLKAKVDEMRAANDEIVSLRKELRNVQETANNTGGAIQGLITKFAGFFAITKLFSFLIDTFNNFQQAQKEIVLATGATGDALRDLTNSMLDVQGSVWQSQQEIAQAIGELNTRLGLTGDELTDFTTKYLNFASVTGQDGKQAIADNVRLFNIWGVAADKQADYLDKLAKAGQLTGVNVSNLTNQLQQNQAALSALGLSLDDSIALLSNFEAQGIEAGDALAAMKIWVNNLVDQGLTPADAIEKIVDSIKNAKTETEAIEIAANTFGKRGGLAMFNAIKNGTFDIEKMKAALEDADGTVEDTYKNMETFWEFLSRKWNGIIADFTKWNNEGFQSFRELCNIINDSLTPAIESVNSKWQDAKNYMADVWKTVKQVANWERDLNLELTEQGKIAEEQNRKQQQLNAVNQEYVNTLDAANKALNSFDKIKIDDSTTRAEFDASKQAALAAADSFRAALQAKIAYTKGQMVGLPMVSQEYVKLSKDLAGLTTQAINAESVINRIKNAQYTGKTKTPGGNGGSGGSGGSGKNSDVVKNAKEELEALRDVKIQEVQNAELSEKEKNEKLLEIYNRYKDELIKIDWKTNDELLKSAEQYIKDYYDKQQKASEKEQKAAQDSIKNAKKYQDAIEKLWDQREEYKNKALKNIREVNNSIAELDKDFNNDIAERYNEVQKTIKDFERENGDQERLKGLGVDTLKNWDSDTISDIKVDDAIEYLNALKESELLSGRLTENQKELAKNLENQSESEKLILQYEQQRAVLEEQKKLYEAFANQWDLANIGKQAIQIEDDIVKYYDATKDQYVEITDFKNQELARDLYNQQIKLQTEYENQQTALNNELELVESHSKKVLAQWQSDTKAYKNELKNRVDAVRDYVNEVQALLASVPSSYRAYGGELNKGVTMVGENWPEAIVRRQSSYVQPRNAVQNYSTVTTSNNNLSINGLQLWNFNTVEDLLAELKNHLTYRN